MPRRLPYRMLKAQLLEQRQALREAIVAYKEALDQARNSNDTASRELIEAALHRAERAVARN